ncbi:MAG: hypothetical protein AAFX04_03575 [Pseudomonadota bacterium]
MLFLFSFLFFAGITFGYVNLFLGFGWFVAVVIGFAISGFAFLLARTIGLTPDGAFKSGKNWFLMAVLLIVSAAGIYNTLMLQFEGEQILADAATESEDAFAVLEGSAETELKTSGIEERVGQIESLKDALFSEMRNPRNCGEGPEAARIISQLRNELPEFRPVSSGRSQRRGQDCSYLEPVIADYNTRISLLLDRASWNNRDLRDVLEVSLRAQNEMENLRQDVSSGYTPLQLKQFVNILEDADAVYRKTRKKLGKETDIGSIPPSLPIVAAKSLGNIYKLPGLIWSRIEYLSTWAYLLLAAGFDFLLVSLFELVRTNKVSRVKLPPQFQG